ATIPYAFDPVLPGEVLPDRQLGAKVVGLLSDLMLGSRLENLRLSPAVSLVLASNAEEAESRLAAGVAAVVIDLTDRGFPFPATLALIRQRAPDAQVIAIYPHVRDDLKAMAQDAACEVVIPRSRFLTDPASIMRSILEAPAVRAGQARV